MLFSGALNLNSLAILISITIFGSIWGMWGVILALPLAAFIKTILSLWPTR
jgi:putative permease